jgi:hypothetical protein
MRNKISPFSSGCKMNHPTHQPLLSTHPPIQKSIDREASLDDIAEKVTG